MNFQNPALLGAGLALLAVPIAIHLLNRRRVRVVDWAAMDFLLEAQQKNRRRVLLENLLLLLLRCLAVGLLALVVGRPLVTSALAGRFSDAAPLERHVLLDDSQSMQAVQGTSSSFDLARERLVELSRQWAAEPTASTLTLRVTSRPDDPIVQGGRLSDERIEEIVDAIRRLEPTDLAAGLAGALETLDRELETSPAAPRMIYLATDLRARDWRTAGGGVARGMTGVPESSQAGNAPANSADSRDDVSAADLLARLARRTLGAVVFDVGSSDEDNLVVAEIEPEGILAVDVPSRLAVKVWNAGRAEARDLEVKFTAGDSLPLVEPLEKLAPGETAVVAFTVTFPGGLLGEEQRETTVPVRAEVTSSDPARADRLAGDSTAYLAARVRRGIPVLLVDGDPSADYGKSETFYLQRALAPPGSVPSGIVAETATVGEFESKSLDAYQVVCLCNVSHVDDARRESLEAWVRAGGGLAILPGDEVDAASYEATWRRPGAELSPVGLVGIRGDETERTWATLRVDEARGSFLTLLAGDDNPLLQRVKTFRWWGAQAPSGEGARDATVLARWNDAEGSPAVVERTYGQGRVVWFAGPADADWSNWTDDPSYLIVMQELVRTLARTRDGSTGIRTGQPLLQAIDLAEFRPEAVVATPRDERLHLSAAPATPSDIPGSNRGAAGTEPEAAGGDAPASGRTIWQFTFLGTQRQGFYDLRLETSDGAGRSRLVAANVDPTEGDLRRADLSELRRTFGDAPIQFLDAENVATTRTAGDRAEIWWYLAWGLAGVLGVEQLLAWRFGKNR